MIKIKVASVNFVRRVRDWKRIHKLQFVFALSGTGREKRNVVERTDCPRTRPIAKSPAVSPLIADRG